MKWSIIDSVQILYIQMSTNIKDVIQDHKNYCVINLKVWNLMLIHPHYEIDYFVLVIL